MPRKRKEEPKPAPVPFPLFPIFAGIAALVQFSRIWEQEQMTIRGMERPEPSVERPLFDGTEPGTI